MKRTIIITFIMVIVLLPTLPRILHKNKGESESAGTVNDGKLINGYKIPYKGENFKYFSIFDYYFLGRCYVHSDIYKIILDSYHELQNDYPEYTYKIMECSRKKGGKPFPHRTHQNGTSIDFMTPLQKDDKTIKRFDCIGMWRYAMNFDSEGKNRFNKNIEIDFDKMAKQIIVMEKVARRHGYKINKVILETNLKDEIFNSKYGEQLKKTDVYFVKYLPKKIDELHDDHFHIDFVKL